MSSNNFLSRLASFPARLFGRRRRRDDWPDEHREGESRRRRSPGSSSDRPSKAANKAASKAAKKGGKEHRGDSPDESEDSETLVETMLDQRRYALLMRPQIAANLGDDQYDRALSALSDGMTLTPEGEVFLRGRASFGSTDDDVASGRLIRVEGLFLDRFAVSNADYQRFVAAGGYEQMSLWSPEIWPGVLHFVDHTGQPGPRYWRYGGCRAGQEHHPVVGVSWYEASAYARWVGKRLATDAEWVKAGAWPVPSPGSPPIQRKFPWGESMERRRANLWGSGAQGTVPVDDYEAGASVSGVYQLIGNVWEWTSTNFGAWDPPAKRLELSTPMKSIRGGAYDTYFDGHAACQFQSGESPLERRHNIGFRCAVGVCDLALRCPQSDLTGENSPIESDADAFESGEWRGAAAELTLEEVA